MSYFQAKLPNRIEELHPLVHQKTTFHPKVILNLEIQIH